MGTQHTDPPDHPDDEDYDATTEDSDCNHSFDNNDETTEFCVFCGEVREYEHRDRGGATTTAADEIHVCRTVGDHAFGLGQACLYCGKPESDLSQAERDLRKAMRRERRGTADDDEGLGIFDD